MLGSGTDVLLLLARPEDCCFAGSLEEKRGWKMLGLLAIDGTREGEEGSRAYRLLVDVGAHNRRWWDVVGACNGLLLAGWCGAQKEKRGGCPCCEWESREEAADIFFVGSIFFCELLTHKGAKGKGCGDFFGLKFVTILEFGDKMMICNWIQTLDWIGIDGWVL